jgi:hypothetical protein
MRRRYFLVAAQESIQRKRHRGSDASAAGGRRSEQSEWQRSIADEGFSKPRKISGTATGMALSVALPCVPLLSAPLKITILFRGDRQKSKSFLHRNPVQGRPRPPHTVYFS